MNDNIKQFMSRVLTLLQPFPLKKPLMCANLIAPSVLTWKLVIDRLADISSMPHRINCAEGVYAKRMRPRMTFLYWGFLPFGISGTKVPSRSVLQDTTEAFLLQKLEECLVVVVVCDPPLQVA